MKETNFPTVVVKSATDALSTIGLEDGLVFNYNPKTGMYTASVEEEDMGPGDKYSYFASSTGFSKGVIDALLEAGIVEVLEDKPKETEPEDAPEGEPEVWDKADLVIECGRCGTKQLVTKAYGGATIYMPTNSDSETRLVCPSCGNKMSLVYENGEMFTEEEKAQIEAQKNANTQVPDDVAQQPMVPDEAVKSNEDESQEESD